MGMESSQKAQRSTRLKSLTVSSAMTLWSSTRKLGLTSMPSKPLLVRRRLGRVACGVLAYAFWNTSSHHSGKGPGQNPHLGQKCQVRGQARSQYSPRKDQAVHHAACATMRVAFERQLRVDVQILEKSINRMFSH